jgi:NRAMP (natural resistance-associated macrophage protein)-like metal ion transporter
VSNSKHNSDDSANCEEKQLCPDNIIDDDNNNSNNDDIRTDYSDPKLPDKNKNKSFIHFIGPGLISGSADNDPSTIATFSQAGAAFGLGFLWLALFQYPLKLVVQEMCARVGLVAGSGLAAVIRKKYSRKVVVPLAALLLIANTINIGADIGAMSSSMRLMVPQVPLIVGAFLFTAVILLSVILIPYKKYVKVLKYLTITLFAYVITSLIVGGDWSHIIINSFIPHFEFNAKFALIFVAMFGTSISPYIFFWQASEEVEEQRARGKKPGNSAEDNNVNGGGGNAAIFSSQPITKGDNNDNNNKKETRTLEKEEVKLMRKDVAIGMAFSQIIMWFIIVTAAGSLNAHGITDIQSTEQAASALEPLVNSFPFSGFISKAIFAIGIIGTGLLSIPVLAASSGYAMADGFGWKEGLDKKFKQAKAFYLVIAASTLVGFWMDFVNIDPIKALIYAAIINEIISLPILIVLMKITNDKRILGSRTNRRVSNVAGWVTIAIMAASILIIVNFWNQ